MLRASIGFSSHATVVMLLLALAACGPVRSPTSVRSSTLKIDDASSGRAYLLANYRIDETWTGAGLARVTKGFPAAAPHVTRYRRARVSRAVLRGLAGACISTAALLAGEENVNASTPLFVVTGCFAMLIGMEWVREYEDQQLAGAINRVNEALEASRGGE